MEVTIQHRGNVQFEAIARGHSIVCDQPQEAGGSDAGMTPPELLLSALGTCAGFYAVQYLKVRSLSQDGLQIRVNASKVPHPARMGSFQIEVTVPGLPSGHQAGMERAVRACLIHNTLLHAPEIETIISSGSTMLISA